MGAWWGAEGGGGMAEAWKHKRTSTSRRQREDDGPQFVCRILWDRPGRVCGVVIYPSFLSIFAYIQMLMLFQEGPFRCQFPPAGVSACPSDGQLPSLQPVGSQLYPSCREYTSEACSHSFQSHFSASLACHISTLSPPPGRASSPDLVSGSSQQESH